MCLEVRGAAQLGGAFAVRAQGRRGVHIGAVVLGAGHVSAEAFAALLGGADVPRAQGRRGLEDGGVGVGAGVESAVGFAAQVGRALATGALDLPGKVDGNVAVRAADGVAVRRVRVNDESSGRSRKG